MKSLLKKTGLPIIFGIALFLFACEDDRSGTFYGPEKHLGKGHVRAYVTLDEAGQPLALGISVPKEATEGLPHDPNDFEHSSAALPFPVEARTAGFDHVLFDWAPEGHEPSGVYTLPHFDIHFYKQALAERDAIPPFEVDSSKFNILPARDFFPVTYFRIPGGVPGMGCHWIDGTAPELNGKTSFTHTFIYGSYNGKVTFWEPMITLDALKKATREVVIDVKQPAKYEAGYYPMQYAYVYDESKKEFRVELRDFLKH